jgi:hypothetical protein
MNRFDLMKKPILVAMAMLTLVMAAAVVMPTTLASAQTHFPQNSPLIRVTNGEGPNNGEVVRGGMLVNMLVYVWSFLREVAGHWFEPGGGTNWQWSDSDNDWVLVGKKIPDMTPEGKAMVGAFVDVIDNLLVYLAQALQIAAAPASSQSN